MVLRIATKFGVMTHFYPLKPIKSNYIRTKTDFKNRSVDHILKWTQWGGL